MSMTVSKRWPKSAPYGDIVVMCDLCGANYQRSKLRKRADGFWACTGSGTGDCFDETSAVALDRANAWATPRGPNASSENGSYSKPDSVANAHKTLGSEIEAT
jgi:hypothetical protein